MNVPIRQARYLWDILFFSREIRNHLSDYSLERYLGDRKTQQAVERCLEIIGEAAAKLEPETLKICPRLPVHEMRTMRNFLIHAYFQIDARRVWETAQHDIPGIIEILAPFEKDLENFPPGV